ncbi:hypothetical protein MMPV_006693 [Pyropia vietnamensis]
MDHAVEASAFRIYRRCATVEYEAVRQVLADALYGLPAGSWSLLDVGARSAGVLDLLPSPPGRYVRVEHNLSFESNLRSAVAARPDGVAAADEEIMGSAFEPSAKHTPHWARLRSSPFTVVLLLGTLAGCSDKPRLLRSAAECVAPGGVLLAFHGHRPSPAQDSLTTAAAAVGHPYRSRVLPAHLTVTGLSPAERFTLSAYIGTPILADQSAVDRPVTYVAVAPRPPPIPRSVTLGRVSRAAAAHTDTCVHLIPRTVATIQVALSDARSRKSRVAVIGGGHSTHCLWPGTTALDLRAWSSATATADGSTVVAGGGATAGAITAAAGAVGRVVPLGDRPSVGAGLVLLGGIGHYSRRWGLATDNLVGVTYVTADGEVRRASTASELWPFRGAGPHFGVVLSMELRAHPLRTVATQKRHYGLGRTSAAGEGEEDGEMTASAAAMVAFSRAAATLPREVTADAFLYAAAGRLRLSTAVFDTGDEHQVDGDTERTCCSLGGSVHTALTTGDAAAQLLWEDPPAVLATTQLPDAELYMTTTMDPPPPSHAVHLAVAASRLKWRSAQRWVLVPALAPPLAMALVVASAAAPPGSYIHLLHAGGAAAAVPPAATAFGCRNWEWAAVITARWAVAICPPSEDGQVTPSVGDGEVAAQKWLAETTAALAPPLGVGIYGADLGPADETLAAATRHALSNLLSPAAVAAAADVTVRSVSADVKAAYAAATPGVDATRLITDRPYKEAHRRGLSAYWAALVAADPAAPRRCLDAAAAAAAADGGRIVLLTGVRDGLAHISALRAVLPTIAVHVTAEPGARAAWGCPPDAATDASAAETAAATADPKTTWDLSFVNGPAVTTTTAAAWVASSLAPALVRAATRSIPDCPRPGVTYRDLVGGLLLQRWGLPLVVALGGLGEGGERASGSLSNVAVLVPEALGVVFGAPLAARLGVPLLVARRRGRLPGAVHSVSYEGSNIRRVEEGIATPSDASGSSNRSRTNSRGRRSSDDSDGRAVLELVAGSVTPGSSVVAVDDTLASGATAAAAATVVAAGGGTLTRLLVVAEFPCAGGRATLRGLGVDVHALVEWQGV